MPGKRQPRTKLTKLRLTTSPDPFIRGRLCHVAWTGRLIIWPAEHDHANDVIELWEWVEAAKRSFEREFGRWDVLEWLVRHKGDGVEIQEFNGRSESRLISKAEDKLAKWESDHRCYTAKALLLIVPIYLAKWQHPKPWKNLRLKVDIL